MRTYLHIYIYIYVQTHINVSFLDVEVVPSWRLPSDAFNGLRPTQINNGNTNNNNNNNSNNNSIVNNNSNSNTSNNCNNSNKSNKSNKSAFVVIGSSSEHCLYCGRLTTITRCDGFGQFSNQVIVC